MLVGRIVFFLPCTALIMGCEPVRDATAAIADSTTVVANDNRAAGGLIRNGTYELRLAARSARWRADSAVDTLVTVQVFAEEALCCACAKARG